jgi:hypothetical protein
MEEVIHDLHNPNYKSKLYYSNFHVTNAIQDRERI